MVSLVRATDGGVEFDTLYGALTKRWPGLSYRTYVTEYIKAARARGDVHYEVNGRGTFVVKGSAEGEE